MSCCLAKRLALAFAVLASTCAVCTQDAGPTTGDIASEALEQLGSESPEARAKARKTILDLGKPGIDRLRRAISAGDEIAPEHLFVIAEDIARERRNLRLALTWELAEKSWRVEWSPSNQLGLLKKYGGPVAVLDADLKPTNNDFGSDASYFAFDPTGKTYAYNNADGEVVITERKTGRQVTIATSDKSTMAYSPDGLHLVTAYYGHTVEMWKVADGTKVCDFSVEGSEGGLTPLFSPNGKLLVVGNRNDTTHVFDVDTGELLHELDRKSSQQPAFSPDGTRLAIGYVDSKIGIWNPRSGTLEKLLDCPGGWLGNRSVDGVTAGCDCG